MYLSTCMGSACLYLLFLFLWVVMDSTLRPDPGDFLLEVMLSADEAMSRPMRLASVSYVSGQKVKGRQRLKGLDTRFG